MSGFKLTTARAFERKAAKNGQPMFNLKAANNEVIGTSETYSSEAARDNGIASVKKNAPRRPLMIRRDAELCRLPATAPMMEQ